MKMKIFKTLTPPSPVGISWNCWFTPSTLLRSTLSQLISMLNFFISLILLIKISSQAYFPGAWVRKKKHYFIETIWGRIGTVVDTMVDFQISQLQCDKFHSALELRETVLRELWAAGSNIKLLCVSLMLNLKSECVYHWHIFNIV